MIRLILYQTLRLFGRAFSDKQLSIRTLCKQVLIQKIWGINRCVPWPVHWTSQIIAPHNIIRGTRFPGLARNCYLDGRNGIRLGANVWIGPRVSLISMNHSEIDFTKYIQTDPIKIGDNCWLGANSIILPGVQLGNHVIVAAGAVVTRSFEEDNILLGGVPATVIKKLDPYQAQNEN